MIYCEKDCFELAKEISSLMGRVMSSSERELTLAQKLAIQAAARHLDAARRELLDVAE
jgi:hypothetical protein